LLEGSLGDIISLTDSNGILNWISRDWKKVLQKWTLFLIKCTKPKIASLANK
jgi:hypothetical protein